ncbi:ribosome maturation protein RimP [Alkalihalobacillus alcalophilus ATCC 27647 = CGMCC 1.3604]|uniref:Ribosome maturation factor RimP n=1 Tax=Alkalihalobacillus alcalophilus ATCC 27647 = CGMCC 1.3604 TaxID=1218173 RepID=A0A094WKE3_ALKAL|nr:ribosome maturation factor RimP [Alkalihalobacillus alcalophilus]KGA98214.1 ribosome maturation factor RimP [Alkalihalobacillus alcalophilus ATCC 27647 = CGMCC 1.3604]MED1562153.1 ribosome maturation factor RimP [Alkalihalobacillus alcalophilus]THG91378.1 ribosome maturation protein RimP [Alkalihalobacillus alcalophilus ATCC 27647 = CGMCC 1.3604]
MSNKVTDVVAELVSPILEDLNLELVEVEFKKEGPNWFLRVFIDSETGVDLEDCSAVSEKLSEVLDEKDPIEQAYFLEVSSPGAERPLKTKQDLEKAIGKYIHVSTYEMLDGQKVFEGDLLSFDGGTLLLEMKIKTRKKEIEIPYEKVAKVRLAIKL